MASRIAVIGCGRIGMRHIEALGRLALPARIYAVDPLVQSRERASDLFAAAHQENNGPVELETCATIRSLPDTLDLVVVATTSQSRLDALATLIGSKKVTALVLEKFLFPSLDQYDMAQRLLQPLAGKVWVNCSRRMYPGYRHIAAAVAGTSFVDVSVSCNAKVAPIGTIAIHFADLLAMLSGGSAAKLDVSIENGSLVPTHRAGIDDFAGMLTATSRDRRYRLRYAARPDTQAPLSVTIERDRANWLIHEWQQIAYVASAENNWTLREMAFPIPMQSRLTDIFAAQILSTGSCQLTPYSESAETHKSLLAPLIDEFRRLGHPSANAVPFT